MGAISSSPTLASRREIKICMHGIYGSGKKSILEKFEVEAKEPGGSIFGDYKETTIKNMSVVSWDVGGRGYNRPLANHYYKQGVDAMLIVVDCTVGFYIEHISYLLKDLLQEKSLKDAIFLVLANKQDLDEACSVEQVAEKLDFHKVTRSHVATIMGCSAKTGEGLQDAIDWLTTSLEAQKERVEKQDEKQGKKSRSLISCVKGGFQALKSMIKRSG